VAKRTIFNASKAGAKNFLGSQELVNDVASGRVDLAAVKEAELPAELKAMTAKERQVYVAARGAKRQALQKKIDELAGKRQAFIEEKVKQEAGSRSDSLDAQIYRCIQIQAAEKDIQYKDGPAY
jgi:hypothetical protein